MKFTPLSAACLLIGGSVWAAPVAPVTTPSTPAPAAPAAAPRQVPLDPNSPLALLQKAGSIRVNETVLELARSGSLVPAHQLDVTVASSGLVRLEQTDIGAKKPSIIVVSDGKTVTEYHPIENKFLKGHAPPDGFGAAGIPDLMAAVMTAVPTPTTLDGASMLLYQVERQSNGHTLTVQLWADPKTHLPERQSVSLGTGTAAQEVQRIVFSDWSLGKPVPSDLFALNLPADASELKPEDMPKPDLLAKGTLAPDFTVQDAQGKTVKLSDYRGKTVVLDFWATWCAPCRASLPHVNQIAKEYKDKNVVVLAVDETEDRSTFDAWLPKHRDLDAITFVHDPSPAEKTIAETLYKSQTVLPTQYVIDPKGMIVEGTIGYDDSGADPNADLISALKTLGVSS